MNPEPATPMTTTRERLLEAAGNVFADKGYAQATSKEICELAGANTAAVNYHFGGKQKLYAEVLRRAHQGIVSLEEMLAALPEGVAAKNRLEHQLGMVLSRFLSEGPSGWHGRLMVREMSNPSPFLDELADLEIRPKAHYLRSLVAEALELEPQNPAASLATVNVMSTVIMLFQNRPVIARVFPELDLSGAPAPDIVRRMTAFCLGGLRALKDLYSD